METKKEVKTFKIDYTCDECKVGVMRPTGIALTTYPMKFPHKCTNCENVQTFLEAYPLTRYEEILVTNTPGIVIKKTELCSYEQGLFNSQ